MTKLPHQEAPAPTDDNDVVNKSFAEEPRTGQLWEKPAVPHAIDDEFESTTLDPAWEWTQTPSVSAIDPYASFSSGGHRYELHTDRRKSWLMVQCEDGLAPRLTKPFTLPTNFFIWTRFSVAQNAASVGSNDFSLSLGFSATSGGEYDNSNQVQMIIDCDSGGQARAKFSRTDNGSGADVGFTETTNYQGSPITYLGVQKIGNVTYGWAGTASGSWIYMGTYTYSAVGGDLDRIHCHFLTTVSPNPILGLDFIRGVESSTFLP